MKLKGGVKDNHESKLIIGYTGINQTKEGLLDTMSKPISNIDDYYTGEIVEKDGVEYSILNTDPLIDKFGSDELSTRGKKVSPTLIRKAIEGEKIDTYVKNGNGEYIHEGHVIAKEGQYVFQNIDNKYDIYIPGDQDVIKEYEGYENITDDFQKLVRKTHPSKLLHEIIQKPTIIVVKSWGNYEQTLDKGATLKLEVKENGNKEVTGINKGGFDAWKITNKDGEILGNINDDTGETFFENKNATINASEYSQTNNRNLDNYKNFLGPDFINVIETKNNKVDWLDVGSGLGVATIQTFFKKDNFSFTTINAQDFWSELFKNKEKTIQYFEQNKMIFHRLIKNFNIEDSGFKLIDGHIPHYSADFVTKHLETLEKKYKELLKSDKYDLLLGYAENILGAHDKKYDLITDVYGAYYYSADRTNILKEYYSHLNENGIGMIIFHSEDYVYSNGGYNIHGPNNIIILPNKTEMVFEEYLSKKYPNIFTIVKIKNTSQSFTNQLRIKKDNSILDLDFSGIKFIEHSYGSNGYSEQIPSSLYKEL